MHVNCRRLASVVRELANFLSVEEEEVIGVGSCGGEAAAAGETGPFLVWMGMGDKKDEWSIVRCG